MVVCTCPHLTANIYYSFPDASSPLEPCKSTRTYSSKIVETTAPSSVTIPTFPPSASSTIFPEATSRFQTTTVLLFWWPIAIRSPALLMENWRGDQPPDGASWTSFRDPSSWMAKVEMVSVGPEPKTGESLKDTSRFETMMNLWSG